MITKYYAVFCDNRKCGCIIGYYQETIALAEKLSREIGTIKSLGNHYCDEVCYNEAKKQKAGK